jgi:hypothetical protein
MTQRRADRLRLRRGKGEGQRSLSGWGIAAGVLQLEAAIAGLVAITMELRQFEAGLPISKFKLGDALRVALGELVGTAYIMVAPTLPVLAWRRTRAHNS